MRGSYLILAALGLVAVSLRVWQIDRESLWLDEAGRVAIASLPFGQIAHGVTVVELSPPLYHYMLALWIRLAGDGDASVRLLSALLVLPAVALGWSVGRAVAGSAVGLALAALVAVSPFAVRYGQEAAMYGLLLPLGLATIRAAVGVLSPLPTHPPQGGREADESPSPSTGEGWGGGETRVAAARSARTRWLLAYVALGTLLLYTHYYAAFLLFTVAVVAIAHSVAKRSRHGTIIWLTAHVVIGVAFAPWLPALVSQAGLAASVGDWNGVGPTEALVGWSGALFAGGARGWATPLALVLATAGCAVGAWRLRDRGPAVWLMMGLVVVPLVLATLASGFFHSFRERGFIAVAGGPWLLVASAIFAGGPSHLHRWHQAIDVVLRALIVAAVGFVTAFGLAAQHAERKEDWRGAAVAVAAVAGPNDPIFFVHYGAQIPFDRYFGGPQHRIGLPESFDWADGYYARYVVTPEDVALRVPAALADARQAWGVFSHDGGRGSDYLIAALDRWGTLAGEQRLVGVRVLRYQARG